MKEYSILDNLTLDCKTFFMAENERDAMIKFFDSFGVKGIPVKAYRQKNLDNPENTRFTGICEDTRKAFSFNRDGYAFDTANRIEYILN